MHQAKIDIQNSCSGKGQFAGRLFSASTMFIAIVSSGCSPAGPGRYTVEGTVTIAGKRAPAGFVTIEPDAELGGTGPQARAEISQGHYQTVASRGANAGPVVIRIQIYDGKPQGEAVHGMPMAKPYETRRELPAEDSTQDFDIPPELALEPVPPPPAI